MKKFIGAFGLWFVFVLCVGVSSVYVGASAVTSGVKALTDNCGETYVVEKVLAGDWFCPEK